MRESHNLCLRREGVDFEDLDWRELHRIDWEVMFCS